MKQVIEVTTVIGTGDKADKCEGDDYHVIQISTQLIKDLMGRKFVVKFISVKVNDEIEIDVLEI